MDTSKEKDPKDAIAPKVAHPEGSGKFDDMITVKATDNHPTMSKGKEYPVHSSHVAYLETKGYIEKVKK